MGADRRFSRAPPVALPRFSLDNVVCCPGCTAWRVRQRSRERGQATMQASEVPRAMAAAMSTASSLDLTVDDAIVLRGDQSDAGVDKFLLGIEHVQGGALSDASLLADAV